MPLLDAEYEETPNSGVTLPDGTRMFTVRDGDYLSKLIAQVYGRYSPARLREVIALNPALTNPNHLNAGTFVIFPPAPEDAGQIGEENAQP